MKKLSLILVAVWVITLSGCETMQGIGKDIQKAGKALEKKAAE